MMLKSGTGQNFFITAKIHFNVKERTNIVIIKRVDYMMLHLGVI